MVYMPVTLANILFCQLVLQRTTINGSLKNMVSCLLLVLVSVGFVLSGNVYE